MSIEKLKEGLDLIIQGQRILASGPFDFYLNKVISAYDYLMENCCPFTTGDRVEIIKKFDFDSNPGLHVSKHFLQIGCKGTVVSTDWGSKGYFIIWVKPDNQTYFYRGEERPVTEPHSFSLKPEYLRIIPSETQNG